MHCIPSVIHHFNHFTCIVFLLLSLILTTVFLMLSLILTTVFLMLSLLSTTPHAQYLFLIPLYYNSTFSMYFLYFHSTTESNWLFLIQSNPTRIQPKVNHILALIYCWSCQMHYNDTYVLSPTLIIVLVDSNWLRTCNTALTCSLEYRVFFLSSSWMCR